MAIVWNDRDRTITLYTVNSSYQMKIDEHNVLLHTYYGKRVYGADMSYLLVMRDRGFSGNPYDADKDRTYSLDVLPQEYGTFGAGDYRQPAIRIKNSDGSNGLELRYVSHAIEDGKYNIPGLPALYRGDGQWASLTVVLKDIAKEVYVYLRYGVYEDNDCITRSVVIENKEDGDIELERVMSLSLDMMPGDYDLIHFPGRYAVERQFERESIRAGVKNLTSLRGTSSHQENPFAIICGADTDENCGEAIGVGLIYSGSFRITVDRDHINQLRILAGIEPDMFSKKLAAGDKFYSPEVMLTYSASGLEKLTHSIHNTVNKCLIRNEIAKKYKPVLVNSWESVYFTYNIDKLKEIADASAELGADLFVLDDGWFGKRENDLSGLGDWYENRDKLGGSLKEFSDYLHGAGMKFGLWFEPECVSEDSDLYRKHPEWALTIPGRAPQRSRYQLILNLAMKDVQEYLYERLSSSIRELGIDYIKWDFNRSLSDWYDNCGMIPSEELPHEYILGLYSLLDRVTTEFPEVLWEGCSGGGGRFDYGILYYMPQIWCSDNTDAINRLDIQYGTSFAYPVSVTGSHVSAVPNHQNGRITPFHTRAAVSYPGTFGYELNIALLSDDEKEQIKRQIEFYKDRFDLIHEGDYYRLTASDNPNLCAWETASGDGAEALVTVVMRSLRANMPVEYVRLRGLLPEARYSVNRIRIEDGAKEHIVTTCGQALISAGIPLPVPTIEYESYIYSIEKI